MLKTPPKNITFTSEHTQNEKFIFLSVAHIKKTPPAEMTEYVFEGDESLNEYVACRQASIRSLRAKIKNDIDLQSNQPLETLRHYHQP